MCSIYSMLLGSLINVVHSRAMESKKSLDSKEINRLSSIKKFPSASDHSILSKDKLLCQ